MHAAVYFAHQQEQVRLSKAAINLAFAEEQEKLAEERRTIKVSIYILQGR